MIRALLAFLLAVQEECRDLGPTLEPIRKKRDVPALAAAFLVGNRVAARGAVGVRKRGEDKPITIDDKFHLGSCTKSMTATLAAIFVEEEKLSWETTVGEVFQDVEMYADWRGVTLAQLLTNRSGAPHNLDADGLWGRLWKHEGSPREQRRTMIEGVLKRAPEAAPGTKFIYSNAGFSIAGAMLEEVADRPWEDLMEERLFRPLGMKSAGFGAPGTEGELDQPRGHTGKGDPVEVGPGSDNPAAIGPAGIVHCTLGDWAKYVAIHLAMDDENESPAKVPKLLSLESVGRLHTQVGDYAMGWGVTKRDWGGGRVLTHNGSNTMWFCVVWIAPRKNFAVLVASNQGGDDASKACDEAAGAIIREHQK